MHTVHKHQIDFVDGSKMFADASNLQIAPGDAYPEFIAVVDETSSGFLLQRASHVGDVTIYRDKAGIELHVFND